jgi:hypothetical protein
MWGAVHDVGKSDWKDKRRRIQLDGVLGWRLTKLYPTPMIRMQYSLCSSTSDGAPPRKLTFALRARVAVPQKP